MRRPLPTQLVVVVVTVLITLHVPPPAVMNDKFKSIIGEQLHRYNLEPTKRGAVSLTVTNEGGEWDCV